MLSESMKSIYLLLSSLLIFMMPLSTIDDFESTIQTGYKEYEVLVNENNLYYNLQIIWGKIDKGGTKIGYGVYLENKTNDSYQVVIADRFFSREIKQNSRGDTIAHFFEVKNLTNPTLFIYNRQNIIVYQMKLPTVQSVSDFDQRAIISNLGLNDSSDIVVTELELGMRSYYTILLISVIVIFVSLIVLAIVLLRKLSVQKIEPNQKEIKPIHFFGSTFVDQQKTTNESDPFANQIKYDFDQEYDHLSVPEKQKKMAQLMRLYNDGLITIDQLNQELRRLW